MLSKTPNQRGITRRKLMFVIILIILLAGAYTLENRYLVNESTQSSTSPHAANTDQVSDADAKQILDALKNVPFLDQIYFTTDATHHILVAATANLDDVQGDPLQTAENIAGKYTSAVYQSHTPVGNAMIIVTQQGNSVFASALGTNQAEGQVISAFSQDGGAAFVQYLKENDHENADNMEDNTWVEIGSSH